MKLTTKIFIDEFKLRNIIKSHLNKNGFKQIGELEINVRSKNDIPNGATSGDIIGINANVEKR